MNSQFRASATPEESAASYPSLNAFAEARRRFLKLCALSSAAVALGLELTGCPAPGSGGGGGSGTAVGGGGGRGYAPWDDPEFVMGDVAIAMGKPVAVVVGGGPIAVSFKDGVGAELVVAGVLTPPHGVDAAADASKKAKAHADLVREAAAKLPSTVLRDAQALEAFENTLRDQLNATLGGGYFEEVSLAEAERESAKRDSVMDDAAPPSDVAQDADVAAAADVVPARAAPIKRPLKARKLWSPCGKAGCTKCKS